MIMILQTQTSPFPHTEFSIIFLKIVVTLWKIISYTPNMQQPSRLIPRPRLTHQVLQFLDEAPGYCAARCPPESSVAGGVYCHFFRSDNAYFWSTQRGAELDLLLFRNGMRWGFEFKCSDAPSMTKSMHIALDNLFLKKIFVVYPGKERYRLHKKVEAVPLSECMELQKTEVRR